MAEAEVNQFSLKSPYKSKAELVFIRSHYLRTSGVIRAIMN